MKFVLLILGFILLDITTCDDSLVVELLKPKGKIRGHILKSETGKEYYAFQEIPYAAPPTGNLRLSVPKVHDNWSNILDATKNTKICMQQLKNNQYKFNITEDCLYLNIYTPHKPNNNGTLATMVWIHPGDFIEGAGAFQYYNPEYLMEYDIIVVTLNYRLGVFGFFFIGEDAIPGNFGLRDQLFALDWLYDNIKAFGGDPTSMAFVGQGSGAASIAYDYQAGRQAPFSCAILQSGSSISPKYYQSDPIKYATKLTIKFKPNFNFSNATMGKQLKSLLQKQPALELLQKSQEIMNDEQGSGIFENLVWLPVVEGYMRASALIDYPMLSAWSAGAVNLVTAMVGFTSGEMTSWASKQNLTALAKKYDKDPSLLINSRLSIPTENRLKAGTELKKTFYTNTTFEKDQAALIKYLNDQVMIPIIKQVYNSSSIIWNYVYQFSYKSKSTNHGRVQDTKLSDTVANGEELKYIWKTGTKLSQSDKIIQKRLLTLWKNFLVYKNPTPDNSSVLNGAKWLPVDEFFTEIQYLDFGQSVKNATNPINFQKINDLMDKYLNKDDEIAVF